MDNPQSLSAIANIENIASLASSRGGDSKTVEMIPVGQLKEALSARSRALILNPVVTDEHFRTLNPLVANNLLYLAEGGGELSREKITDQFTRSVLMKAAADRGERFSIPQNPGLQRYPEVEVAGLRLGPEGPRISTREEFNNLVMLHTHPKFIALSDKEKTLINSIETKFNLKHSYSELLSTTDVLGALLYGGHVQKYRIPSNPRFFASTFGVAVMGQNGVVEGINYFNRKGLEGFGSEQEKRKRVEDFITIISRAQNELKVSEQFNYDAEKLPAYAKFLEIVDALMVKPESLQEMENITHFALPRKPLVIMRDEIDPLLSELFNTPSAMRSLTRSPYGLSIAFGVPGKEARVLTGEVRTLSGGGLDGLIWDNMIDENYQRVIFGWNDDIFRTGDDLKDEMSKKGVTLVPVEIHTFCNQKRVAICKEAWQEIIENNANRETVS